jgi:hypothetical protein
MLNYPKNKLINPISFDPTDSQILKYILIKKGVFTEKDWEISKEELKNILIEDDKKASSEVEKFCKDFLENFKGGR